MSACARQYVSVLGQLNFLVTALCLSPPPSIPPYYGQKPRVLAPEGDTDGGIRRGADGDETLDGVGHDRRHVLSNDGDEGWGQAVGRQGIEERSSFWRLAGMGELMSGVEEISRK